MPAVEPAAFMGDRIHIVDAVQAGAEIGFVPLQKNGPLPGPIAEHHTLRCLSDRILHQPGRNFDPVPVYGCPGIRHKFQCFGMGQFDTGSLQHFQGCHMQLRNLIIIDDLKSGFTIQIICKNAHFLSPFVKQRLCIAKR